ncbi:uncharacterized protein JN550_007652 [Neoarthrinium moseri]|uniref:uncharacterized protein n=1 Tax=Neoarthrinium moseri TaxID=1658444 RepID=UPI001FDE33F0|nr:uncharacterized protein JN550_007652 [Neoarthrinium moseri]KAI1866264.1 hypothetical protein JN550_007652 [Neoarthrinium moseri]
MCYYRYRGYLQCRHADTNATPLKDLPCTTTRRLGVHCGLYLGHRVVERLDTTSDADRDYCLSCRITWIRLLEQWEDRVHAWKERMPNWRTELEQKAVF